MENRDNGPRRFIPIFETVSYAAKLVNANPTALWAASSVVGVPGNFGRSGEPLSGVLVINPFVAPWRASCCISDVLRLNDRVRREDIE